MDDGNVITFPEAPTSIAMTCPCGGEWFRLERSPNGDGPAICVQDGGLAGFAGTPVCLLCGEEYEL